MLAIWRVLTRPAANALNWESSGVEIAPGSPEAKRFGFALVGIGLHWFCIGFAWS